MQCLHFAAQDAVLSAAAAWTPTVGNTIGSTLVQEGAAAQASSPRRSGEAAPSARVKLLSRLSVEALPQRPTATPTASEEDLAAAACLALGLPAPPLEATAPPGVAPPATRAATGAALAEAKAEAEAVAVSAACVEEVEEEVAAQRRKVEAAEEAGSRLAAELGAAQAQLRDAGGQGARHEARAQEAEALVSRYQQHIIRLQAAQAAREEEVPSSCVVGGAATSCVIGCGPMYPGCNPAHSRWGLGKPS